MTEQDEFGLWTMKVLAAATAHKEEAMRRGFTEEAAEAMAVTLHSVLMASIYEEAAEGTVPGLDNPEPE